jgi:SAM-dependent methyltransferase
MSQSDVKHWFDSIAVDYKKRYDGSRVWHTAVFQLRTRLALQLTKPDGAILDYGAGTGLLYDALCNHPLIEYYAYDISADMLAQGKIPPDRQSTVWQPAHYPLQYDMVYMLGVSNYMSVQDFEHTLHQLHDILKPSGSLIISFTYASGIESVLRKFWRTPFKWLRLGTAGQSFDAQAYTPYDVERLLGSRWHLGQPVFFNVSLTPLQHLFPRMMALLNRKPVKKACWASDFMLCITRD